MNVYESCPVLTSPHFTLRLVSQADASGLLTVYRDPDAQRCFNADNCTSNFCYTTPRQMEDCIHMWLWSYAHGYFVRWTILEGETPVGTVEMFRRDDADGGTGVLRMDLHSRLENEAVLNELLSAILPDMHGLFGCECILTKAAPEMAHRCAALLQRGFIRHPLPLIGEDGTAYPHYWAHRHKLG